MPILEIEYGKLLEQTDFTHLPDESYLFLLTKSPACYEFDGKILSAEAEQALCCRPGQGISVRPLEKYLILDYVCFLPPANVPISQLELLERTPSHPSHFFELSDYFRRIFNLDNSADKYREQKMEAYLQILIYALASGDENRPDNSHAGALHHQLLRCRSCCSGEKLHLLRRQRQDLLRQPPGLKPNQSKRNNTTSAVGQKPTVLSLYVILLVK